MTAPAPDARTLRPFGQPCCPAQHASLHSHTPTCPDKAADHAAARTVTAAEMRAATRTAR